MLIVVPTCISGSTGRPAADVMPRRLNWLLTYTTMNLFANIVYNHRRVLHTFTRHRTKLITPTTSTPDISSVKSPAAVVLRPSVTGFKRNLAKLTLSSFYVTLNNVFIIGLASLHVMYFTAIQIAVCI